MSAKQGGALKNGCTTEEIGEAMTMVGIDAGIPDGVEGFRSAEIVLAEID